jgi:D-glycero-D-manno-heptose 1,7-bisphosphate phosphatase
MTSPTPTRPRRAAFLDRDGVLVEILRDPELGILYTAFHPDQLRIPRNVEPSLRRLRDLGFERIVVSNQPGVAKGHFTGEHLSRVHERLQQLVDVDAIYVCPHHPDAGSPCDCRKPAPGMLLRAARERGIDLSASVMIGDSLDDVRAGERAGTRTVLLNGGRCELCPNKDRAGQRADATVASLAEAVDWIERTLR